MKIHSEARQTSSVGAESLPLRDVQTIGSCGAVFFNQPYGAAGGGWVPNWTELGGGTDAEILFALDVKTAAESAAVAELKACVPIV